MATGILPSGSRGFDCNVKLTSDVARFFAAAKYRFVMRYVGRMVQKTHDLTAAERELCLRAGLAVGVVQHVAPEGWVPDAQLGKQYGKNAARFARECDYSRGASLWCDLEGVRLRTPKRDVIDYVNAWTDAVDAAAYDPGLYVGWQAGIGGWDLYYRLHVRRYWAAYNLDVDAYPVVRGVQMRQHEAGSDDKVPAGWQRKDIDVNLIGIDRKGDSPILELATGDR